MPGVKTAILISGRGSNMAALISAAEQKEYPAEIALVLSNVADAPGLDHARGRGIETAVVSHRDFDDRSGFEERMTEVLDDHGRLVASGIALADAKEFQVGAHRMASDLRLSGCRAWRWRSGKASSS